MCSGTGRFPSIATLILAILLPLTAPPAGAGTIVVRPGKLDHFVMSAPESAVAGESFLVRIEPYDASGNLISDAQNQTGNFSIVVSGSAEASPARIKPADFAGGITVKVVDKRSDLR